MERRSILSYDDDDMPSTSRKGRFSKMDASKTDQALNVKGEKAPTKQHGRYVPFNRNNNQKRGVNNPKKRPIQPWACQEDLISPFKGNIFPNNMNANPATKTSPSHLLFTEFTKICRNELYGTCNGNAASCNGNHTFPDGNWVKSMIWQMSWEDIEKFMKSCYKSVPCSIRYFHILSSYFGRKNMKHFLVEAIPMAESHTLLLQNYKWIVDGLIHTGVTPTIAIRTLLANRHNFSPQSNRIVVEIIVKTELEKSFLEKLVEISEVSSEVYSVEMFHKFIMLAMEDPPRMDWWKTLIENILQSLTAHDMCGMLDQALIANFIEYLAKEEEAAGFQN